MFIIHDDKGEITQSVVGPDPKTYGPVLDQNGLKWLFAPELMNLAICDFYVRNGEIVPKPTMEIAIDRPRIAADGADIARVSHIPRDATVLIRIDGVDHQSLHMSDGTLEISSSVPAIYTVMISAFPFKPWAGTIEVTP